MPTVFFTTALRRFLPASTAEVEGGTVGEALDIVFGAQPELRSYVLDDQGRVRRHVAIYVNGRQLTDRATLSERVGARDEIHVFQALSGG
jgi:molybdopterin synthase sulfur carrier subunit